VKTIAKDMTFKRREAIESELRNRAEDTFQGTGKKGREACREEELYIGPNGEKIFRSLYWRSNDKLRYTALAVLYTSVALYCGFFVPQNAFKKLVER
jgi:hypothetical protein